MRMHVCLWSSMYRVIVYYNFISAYTYRFEWVYWEISSFWFGFFPIKFFAITYFVVVAVFFVCSENKYYQLIK